jgi:hypothetical protein
LALAGPDEAERVALTDGLGCETAGLSKINQPVWTKQAPAKNPMPSKASGFVINEFMEAEKR